MVRRMSYTFRRASRAMLATSSTTSVAFLANLFSDIMPIAAFGVFVAIIIPINYLLVILLIPSEVVIWETYIKRHERCEKCRKQNNKVDEENN